MKVTAIARGFHGKLREPGDVFEVPSGAQAKWFTPAEAGAGPRTKAKKASPSENEGSADGDTGAESLV
ncbi:hypothetical protein [Castellaniella sp.]|uniref:hypothetical protein n=1 Tax=Castellaniella sp. TaxID=1955812 RepID=UPI002AFE6CA3|nr:hypothetical protein [Castellaniella sp.]